MKKQERAEYILKKLEDIYPETPVPLDHSNPFTLLVAVLLSAQSTDKKVNEITPPLFKKANSAKKMLKLSEDEIKDYIAQVGLAPKKSKAIRGLSQMLVDKHGGKVPQTFEELEELPGVGHKTAGVVLAQAFDVPAFPVDTHIHRLAQRWGLTNGKNVVQTEKDLKKLFPKESWNKLHLQIIFYGREYCTARGCDGTRCEICKACYPRRKKPPVVKKA